jgi:hypothetical protein
MKYFTQILLMLLLTPCWVSAQSVVPIDTTLKRVVSARVFYQNIWTVSNETVETVAQTLAHLQPTYISGLIYLDDKTVLSDKHIQAYRAIQKAVQALRPICKLDITLNPNHYKKSEDLIAKMQAINAQLKPDIWYLDFAAGAYTANDKIVQAAIDFAHQNGQLIGGNELNNSLLKNGDFVAFTDAGTVDLNMKEQMLKILAQYDNLRVVFQINNNSQKSSDDTIHTFIKKWSKIKREEYIKRLSRNQVSWKYRLMYPVFFPVFLHKESYNASKDDTILETYLKYMIQYN